MKQVVLDSRGQVQAVDVPPPVARPGHVLVDTAYAVISAGTELAMVRHYASGWLRRAVARSDALRTLTQQVAMTGLGPAVHLVRAKLGDLHPLGYSLSGIVREAGAGAGPFAPGDRVACAGAEYAHHAEVVLVPHRLVAPVPAGVSLRAAAFAGLGAIAVHAVRRCRAAIGETVAVIGLGLVGQLVAQILRSAGCRVIGVEPSAARVALAGRLGCSHLFAPGDRDIGDRVRALTAGLGVDAAIICAAAQTSEPVTLATALTRERGRVVVLGDVLLQVDRAEFYRKELDLVMSRSLGPGRYDPAYEDGRDYPAAFVRWSANRNMLALLDLLHAGLVDAEALISAEVDITQAAAGYRHLRDDVQGMAVVLRAGAAGTPGPKTGAAVRHSVPLASARGRDGRIAVGLIGAGAFARSLHLPLLRRSAAFAVQAVASVRGIAARNAGRQIGARYATTETAEILDDPAIDVVWITTPHDSHADLAVRALDAGKHVFVEKPLALTLDDCQRVRAAAIRAGRLLTVGFNRRFAPASALLRAHLTGSGPYQVTYRVAAPTLPPGHWLDDPGRGGGRLVGEGCHFFDWMAWLLDEAPVRVWATRARTSFPGITVSIDFAGGSTGTLIYACTRSNGPPKERVEVLGDDRVAVIEDFRAVELYRVNRRPWRRRAAGKGYVEQLQAFEQALRGRVPLAVTVDDGVRATACALAAHAALDEGRPQAISAACR